MSEGRGAGKEGKKIRWRVIREDTGDRDAVADGRGGGGSGGAAEIGTCVVRSVGVGEPDTRRDSGGTWTRVSTGRSWRRGSTVGERGTQGETGAGSLGERSVAVHGAV